MAYAQSQGYVLDPQASFKNALRMQHADGDRILVVTQEEGTGYYYSLRDEADHGTLLDLALQCNHDSLDLVRAALRPWLYDGAEAKRDEPPKPVPTGPERQQLLLEFARALPVYDLQYLASLGIHASILTSPRFRGAVRQDVLGNLFFPHIDAGGMIGFEVESAHIGRHSMAGEHGVWLCNRTPTDSRLVVVERAVDALAYAQLHPGTHTRYVSIGGQLSPTQRRLLQVVLANTAKRGEEIVIATGGGEYGYELADVIGTVVPPGARAWREVPETGECWSDVLGVASAPAEAESGPVGVGDDPPADEMGEGKALSSGPQPVP